MAAASQRLYNFSAGPAVMPVEVLEEVRDNLLVLGDTGIGVMEHSHRGAAFTKIIERAEALCREIGNIPDDYAVLFLQGGASLQFGMLPMNFLPSDRTADYLLTGSWSKKAMKEAALFGGTHAACSSEDKNFSYIPAGASYSDEPVYVHFTSNNTIFGTQFQTEPACPDGSFLACDASSDIFSRPVDVTKYGLIYAGAQKNLGPAGVTLVILRKDLLGRIKPDLPSMLDYNTFAESGSLYNTPPTLGIYVVMLVLEWIKKQGGLPAVNAKNQSKATRLYEYLDDSEVFKPTVAQGSRSQMSVCFVTGDADRDARFIAAAQKRGLAGLKGHRSVGGMRASIYNAFPAEGVDELVSCMKEFERAGA